MFSLERLLAIVKPFSFQFLQKAKTARIIIVMLLIPALLSSAFAGVRALRQCGWLDDTSPVLFKVWGAIQDPAQVSWQIRFTFYIGRK